MPAPWEIPAAPAANKKPWELTPEESAVIAKQKGIVQHEKSAPTVIQRMPEGVSKVDRALVANFANDPAAAMDWLQSKYPQFDIAMVGDQIAMKPKGTSNDYMAFIPNASVSDIWNQPENLLQKVSDHAYDIASGLATAGAAALGAGATSPSGPGALAGGAAAAGATGAALETARQQVGKELGINKELKPGQIATQGVLNAATVPLFGAGAAKGLAGAGYDWVAGKALPKLGEAVSGIPSQAILNQAKNAPIVAQMSKEGPRQLARQVRTEVRDTLNNAKNQVGSQIGEAVGKAQGDISLEQVKQPWKDLLVKLQQDYQKLGTPELKKKIEDVSKEYDYYFSTHVADEFGNPVKTELMSVNPQQAFKLKQSMAELGDLSKVKKGGIQSSLEGKSAAEKELVNAARDSENALNGGISVVTQDSTGADLAALNKQYGEIVQQQRDLNNVFKNTKTTTRAMQSGDQDLLATLRDMDQNYGSDLVNKAKIFDAYKYFGNPSFTPISSMGSVSTGRSVPLAATGATAGGLLTNKLGLGYTPGAIAGGIGGAAAGGPAAMKQYINIGRGIRNVQGVLGPMNSAPAQVGANLYQNNMSPWTLFPEQEQPAQ